MRLARVVAGSARTKEREMGRWRGASGASAKGMKKFGSILSSLRDQL